MNKMVQYLIIRDGWNLGADMLESIYIASNTTSLLNSYQHILGTMDKISRPEKIVNLGLKARPLHHIEVNT